ncbi:hypothetical protein COCC4DRAFT_191892 [Bipolaris maydis ATCC 48331]|uniref:Response regulatory domain-containing protein n=3 Tax=Cochliobolus heterostrophus TaxID=5016 RepID=M2UI95_COCH5|nr:uncharacterized protein COCC4DRAFT_191892 [Bipolaris maydis ATCC 48331]AAR29882.1 putative histidine kinase HHK3p [Bipolaris maydis]EMD93386.1 hypothetical protein COCHEDRAFT_88732 [Bipolaris maydis C5]ENI07166.1 hypothetical protein COCC4DRAFT_191892 [Bipolaris maydis ATCC 48331]KAH7562329.1 hypothetical protein BM1_01849 [Bipolaris maydis]KAJ5027709.1 hypothetical protein J3E73DRAFT_208507 [Bipolaris maydis]
MPSAGQQRVAFFPKADAAVLTSRHAAPVLADRPTTTAPILDPEHVDIPLDAWTPAEMQAVYPDKTDTCALSPIPAKEQCPRRCHGERYLFPVLAPNERLRLTMLFYYTRGLLEDQELMSRLQEKVLLAHETVGWEFVITGLLNHNTYTRLVTVNLPLAILPRRESTCSHTINQTPDSIFALHNMVYDWRFEKSPHVEVGGLRAYAGVPLKFETEFGQHVAFGSLCVASNSPQELLSPVVQQSLIRLADGIVSDIVHSARARRQKERRRMLELICDAQRHCDEHADMEQEIPKIVQEIYPGMEVVIKKTTDGYISLESGTTFSTCELEHGLWEDTDYFDYAVKHLNHLDMTAPRAVRAIAAQCASQTVPTFLVVACNDLKRIFDDVDSWFVQTCAMVLCRFWQNCTLQEALAVKESFLRGITHQLRTPIHGILGSAELLTEVLKTRNAAHLSPSCPSATKPETEQLDLSTYVQTIRTSAKELISTVNSLIKLNQWAEIAQAERVMALHRVSDIEAALLHEVLMGLPDDLSIRPSIMISHRFPKSCDMLVIDIRVFLDCIQPLVALAAQQSAGGVVAVVLTVEEDYRSLAVNIYYTRLDAVRSPSESMNDIYTKDDFTTAESALGLTIACKAAALLNGEVEVLSSKHDSTSFYRTTFNNPICASSLSPPFPVKNGMARLPQKFYRLASESPMSSLGHHFSHWLSNTGWLESKEKSESLVIVDYHSDLVQFYQQLASVGTEQVIICLVPENATFLDFQNKRVRRQENAVYVQGPFLTEQLLQAMELVTAILVESRRPTFKPKDFPFCTAVAEPKLISAPQVNAVETENLVKQGSIFPKKTQTQLAESLQTLRLRSKPSLPAGKLVVNSNKPRALLVDDNTVNLRLLQMYCDRRGISYQTAKDGLQAVKIFSEAVITRYDPLLQRDVSATAFDLILMDLQMPECDGIDATRQIRRLEEENKWEKSVLFIVTGQDSPTDRKNAEEAGADEFLTKPLGPKVLDQWVKKWYPEAGI